MSYLAFVVLVVPAAVGLTAAWLLGARRGLLVGGVATLVIVLLLLVLQISLPETGPYSGGSRFPGAFGLMRFEAYRWLPSFLVGLAIGALIHRARRRGAGGRVTLDRPE